MPVSQGNVHCVMKTSSAITLYKFAMRTIIDLPDSQIAAPREVEQRKHLSLAEFIRQAVAHYWCGALARKQHLVRRKRLKASQLTGLPCKGSCGANGNVDLSINGAQ